MKIKSVSVIAISLLVIGVGTGCSGKDSMTSGTAAKSTTKEVAKAEVKMQTNCPVMGGAVDKKFFVDAQGKRIYLCCEDCVAVVKKDPKKYIDKIEAEGITLAKTPVEK